MGWSGMAIRSRRKWRDLRVSADFKARGDGELIVGALARGQHCKPVTRENLPRGLAAQKVRKPLRLRVSPDRQRHRIPDGWVSVFGKDTDHAHTLLGLRVRL